MTVAEEVLKNISNLLKGEIGKGIGNEVGQNHVLESTGKDVNNDKELVGTHEFEESEIEAFPLDTHQKHVVHHDCTEQEQGEDDELEHDSDEKPNKAQQHKVCRNRHTCLEGEESDPVHKGLPVLAHFCISFLVVRVGIDRHSVFEVNGSFTRVVTQVEVFRSQELD